MRLWPLSLLSKLPRQQLLGQHRECCALRGRGWGKKHSVVNYVFNHPYSWLYVYHCHVMNEMNRRGYQIEQKWFNNTYRGKIIGFDKSNFTSNEDSSFDKQTVYHEHNLKYLKECLKNLSLKGISL